MRIQCDRAELSERLQAIAGVVPAGGSIKPILQDVHLKAVEDDLIVEVTDLDIAARLEVSRVDVLEAGELALPAGRLQSLVREIPSNTLALESAEDGRAAKISAESYNFKLLGDDPAEFPEVLAFVVESALGVQREKFVETLRRVSIASSRDQSRYQLTGVYFDVDGNKLSMTATDGKRLTHDEMRIENPTGLPSSGIVPNRAVDVILKVLAQGEHVIQLALTDTELQISFAFGLLSSKLIEGTYPDYHKALSNTPRTKVSMKRGDLLSAVRSASLVTSRDTSTIVFDFQEGTISLETQASDIGESNIAIPAEVTGESVSIRFNPVFLLDALRAINEDEIRMELFGPELPGALRADQHYRHFLMPLIPRENDRKQ